MTYHFTGPVIEWRGPAPYFYVVVPGPVSEEIQELAASISYGWGVIPVEAVIAETSFGTSLFPKDGGYLLPLRDAVRKPLGIALDDRVNVQMRLRRP
ncbi:MAG TPA: DUF1905 domain-containing protein [Mycobacteriales bacterium]|nr:DUF1905 domain-containing protein [Mycobacteriales bacterium]